MEQLVSVIVSGLLGAFGVLGVQFLKNIASKREHNLAEALHEQKQEDRLEQIMANQEEIKKKLDIHNGYAERFVEIEKAMIRVDGRLDSIDTHVNDIEKRITKGGK